MTVIAYRAGIMAGDSCVSDGSSDDNYPGLILSIGGSKVRVLKGGALYGGSGAVDDRDLVHALDNVRSAGDFPTLDELRHAKYGDLTALVALPDNTIWRLDGGPKIGGLMEVVGPFAAIGSGSPIAIGAMGFGATAQQAVAVTCRHHVYCRFPITQVKFDGKRRR